MRFSRRKFLLASAGAGAAPLAYGSLIEKNLVSVTRRAIPLRHPYHHLHGTRIALMADFHYDDFGNENLMRQAVRKINDEKVDVAILGGDFITNDPSAAQPLAGILKDLRVGLGVFGVLGNHDFWHFQAGMVRDLEEAGIRLLFNRGVEFDDFSVVGLESVWGSQPDLATGLRSVSAEKPVVLAWHEPDTFATYSDPRVILQVSGHTHGGQVCAPIWGPILLPTYGRQFPYGYYSKGSRNLFVTRGIGTSGVPARFLCPPEVAILTLTDFTRSEG